MLTLCRARGRGVHQLHTSHQKGQGKPVQSLYKVQSSLVSRETQSVQETWVKNVRMKVQNALKSHSEP